ncbi:MAG: hypothetical protein ACOYT4_02790 [Nanoarchaeota archaeon]
MQWGRFILLVQALVTFIIGMIFFSQFMTVAFTRAERLSFNPSMNNNLKEDELDKLGFDLNVGGYILVTVALIELIVILRLMML